MDNTLFGSTEAAARGGDARARSMSASQRQVSARLAAEARWGRLIRQATHSGTLDLGGIQFACAVLDDGTRVISERGLLAGLGIPSGGGLSAGADDLPLFVAHKNLRSFVDHDLAVLLKNPVLYRAIHGGKPAHGLKAELIPQVCNVWLKARDAKALSDRQKIIAAKADIIMRGLAHVGIVALVDEATGYQDFRARDALAKILEAFVAKELRKWVRTFPPDFYKELFRLRGLSYPPKKNPPQSVGALTNDIIYNRLAPGVLDELRHRNPTNERGNRSAKHHQWLTADIGHPKLLQHLSAVTALMKASDTYDNFKRLLDRALPKYIPTPLLDAIHDEKGGKD